MAYKFHEVKQGEGHWNFPKPVTPSGLTHEQKCISDFLETVMRFNCLNPSLCLNVGS